MRHCVEENTESEGAVDGAQESDDPLPAVYLWIPLAFASAVLLLALAYAAYRIRSRTKNARVDKSQRTAANTDLEEEPVDPHGGLPGGLEETRRQKIEELVKREAAQGSSRTPNEGVSARSRAVSTDDAIEDATSRGVTNNAQQLEAYLRELEQRVASQEQDSLRMSAALRVAEAARRAEAVVAERATAKAARAMKAATFASNKTTSAMNETGAGAVKDLPRGLKHPGGVLVMDKSELKTGESNGKVQSGSSSKYQRWRFSTALGGLWPGREQTENLTVVKPDHSIDFFKSALQHPAGLSNKRIREAALVEQSRENVDGSMGVWSEGSQCADEQHYDSDAEVSNKQMDEGPLDCKNTIEEVCDPCSGMQAPSAVSVGDSRPLSKVEYRTATDPSPLEQLHAAERRMVEASLQSDSSNLLEDLPNAQEGALMNDDGDKPNSDGNEKVTGCPGSKTTLNAISHPCQSGAGAWIDIIATYVANFRIGTAAKSRAGAIETSKEPKWTQNVESSDLLAELSRRVENLERSASAQGCKDIATPSNATGDDLADLARRLKQIELRDFDPTPDFVPDGPRGRYWQRFLGNLRCYSVLFPSKLGCPGKSGKDERLFAVHADAENSHSTSSDVFIFNASSKDFDDASGASAYVCSDCNPELANCPLTIANEPAPEPRVVTDVKQIGIETLCDLPVVTISLGKIVDQTLPIEENVAVINTTNVTPWGCPEIGTVSSCECHEGPNRSVNSVEWRKWLDSNFGTASDQESREYALPSAHGRWEPSPNFIYGSRRGVPGAVAMRSKWEDPNAGTVLLPHLREYPIPKAVHGRWEASPDLVSRSFGRVPRRIGDHDERHLHERWKTSHV